NASASQKDAITLTASSAMSGSLYRSEEYLRRWPIADCFLLDMDQDQNCLKDQPHVEQERSSVDVAKVQLQLGRQDAVDVVVVQGRHTLQYGGLVDGVGELRQAADARLDAEDLPPDRL